MSGSRQRWIEGDVLSIVEEDGTSALWSVVERAGRGWRLRPCLGGDTRTLADGTITEMRRRIERLRMNPLDLPADRAELLKRAFEAHPHGHQVEARRRAAYVRHVERLRERKLGSELAFVRSVAEIWEARRTEWEREDAAELAARQAAARPAMRKEAADTPPKPIRRLAQPSPAAVEAWYHLWLRGGKDIRILIPLWGKRGYRTPRLDARVYVEMKLGLERDYLSKRRAKLASVLREVNKRLERVLGLSTVSYKCLRHYLVTNYSDREEVKRRYSERLAHLRFDVFRRLPDPENPLDVVEIDHCLLDIVVVDEVSGRPLGRPWLTLVLDVKTRMVLGMHVSFEVPSYASVQRALAHAFWPKDLTGMGLLHPWPTEGVAKIVRCDHGREFHSRSLAMSEVALGFTILYTPGRQPWMKGRVERVFGTIGVAVFDLEHGKTFSNSLKRGEYDAVKAARMSLPELKRKLVKYVVDDYHVSYHDGLKGVPLEEWNRSADLDGVEGVGSWADIRRLTGATFLRPISNVGVRLFGHHYYSAALSELRGRRGGTGRRFEIRVDPFDIGEIELLDVETGQWLVVPSDRPGETRGVSIHQHRVRRRRGRKIQPSGELTEATMREAARLEDEEAAEKLGDSDATTTAAHAARYGLDNGAFVTPLVGAPVPANDRSPAKGAPKPAPVAKATTAAADATVRDQVAAEAQAAVLAELQKLLVPHARSVA